MTQALTPEPEDTTPAPAAADPGNGAPGTPTTNEPDVLPNAEILDASPKGVETPDATADPAEQESRDAGNPPFRTPTPGESLAPEDLQS